ncbi:MAG TPA: AMP-binding protein, partial [Marmoricola sp.]|nr:AMP-binding protein [Marmoricola sp.]
QLYILDGQGQPVPIGVAGELHIGGVQVGRGYLNRPELTAERFLPNPFAPGRLYKTGDLCRWLPDGVIDYLGRIDHQVKIRGFRIELGEIEAVLAQQPGVLEAVVVAQREASGQQRLLAYLVGKTTLAPDSLRQALQQLLPDYMIPARFIQLDAMPLSPNGKVDRKRLPAPSETSLAAQQPYEPPQTPTEVTLAQIWAEVLRLQQVGRHDNFFEIGGDSIISLQVISRARVAGLLLKPRQIFEAQTIAAEEMVHSTAINAKTASDHSVALNLAAGQLRTDLATVQAKLHELLRLNTATATKAVLAKIGNPQREEPLQTSKEVFEIAEKDQETLTALFVKPFKNLIGHRFTHHSSLDQHEMNLCAKAIFAGEANLLERGIEIAQRLYAKSNHPNI